MSIVQILGNEKLIPEKPHINMCDPPKFHKIMGGYDAVPRNYYSITLLKGVYIAGLTLKFFLIFLVIVLASSEQG